MLDMIEVGFVLLCLSFSLMCFAVVAYVGLCIADRHALRTRKIPRAAYPYQQQQHQVAQIQHHIDRTLERIHQ